MKIIIVVVIIIIIKKKFKYFDCIQLIGEDVWRKRKRRKKSSRR